MSNHEDEPGITDADLPEELDMHGGKTPQQPPKRDDGDDATEEE